MTGYRFFCTVCDLQICELCEFAGLHDISHSRLKYIPVASTPMS